MSSKESVVAETATPASGNAPTTDLVSGDSELLGMLAQFYHNKDIES